MHLNSIKNSAVILFPLITWACFFSQIPVQVMIQQLPEVQNGPYVTLSGFSYGHHKASEVIRNRHLTLNNNTSGLIIVSFNASCIKDGKLTEFKCMSDSLSQPVIDYVLTLSPSIAPNFHIDNIKATNVKKDTVILPPIVFNITN